MSLAAWGTLAIVLAAIALFASEKVRVDIVALIVLVLLVLFDLVTPHEALAGFSNEATVTVAAMFALSLGIERSGALNPLIQRLSRIRKPWLLSLALMLAIAPMGAFIKNVALVAMFLPLALRVCARTHTSPSRVLMPMAFAAQMGGVCTLLGTSSNLLADSLARKAGLTGFGVFEFTKLGAILAVAGIAYLMLVGRWLLARGSEADLPSESESGSYVTELRVKKGSPLVGRTIASARLGEAYGVYPLELLRGEQHLWAPREQRIEAGDVLLVRGEWERLETFRREARLELAPDHRRSHDTADAPRVLMEALVGPGSRLLGDSIGEIDFPGSHDADVLAVQRRGTVLREQLRHVRLAVGDVLLLLVDTDARDSLRRKTGLVALSERDARRPTRRRAVLAVGILLGVVAVAGLGLLPIVVAALAGCALMAVTGCFRFGDVYEAIDWKVIVTLGAILPLGLALDKSGLARVLVDAGLTLVGDHGPAAALLMVYLLTALLTEFMGHNPSVVLMVPLAISVAHALGVDARPFAVTVAFAAATSFATPVGYPTNTMVYNAGGYRFVDFLRIGVPLIALFCALSVWLIPRFWPFHP